MNAAAVVSTVGRIFALAIGLLISLPAYACPSCASREGGVGEVLMLGVGISMPFVVIAILLPTIRKASDQGLGDQLSDHIERNRGV